MPTSSDPEKDCVFQADETEKSKSRIERHPCAMLRVFVSLFQEKGANRRPETFQGYAIKVGNTDSSRLNTVRFELYLGLQNQALIIRFKIFEIGTL